jgi:hypothetical protein
MVVWYLIDDTQGALNYLKQWKISHVKRNDNEVAHRLAKKSSFLTMSMHVI